MSDFRSLDQDPINRERQWVASLKEGDDVAIFNGWTHTVLKVAKITPTQVHVSGYKFRRDDARRIGGSTWDRISLRELTQDVRDEIERRRLLAFVENVKWKTQSTELLRAIKALVKQ